MGALQDAVAAFAIAPFVHDGWDRALRSMASATGSSRGQLLANGDRHVHLNWCTDVGQDYFDDFVAINGYRADVNYRIGAIRAPFVVSHEKHYEAIRAVATNDAYLQHCKRFDAEFGAQIVLIDRPGTFFGLAALRAASDGQTHQRERQALSAIAPHALAAIRIQTAMERQGAEVLRGSLEAMRVGATLLDARGLVCAATPAADLVLSSGSLRIIGGALHAASPLQDRELQRRIAAALARKPSFASDLWIEVEGRPTLVEANPLPRAEWSFGFAPAAVVTFRAPVTPGAKDPTRLSTALRLTAAEGEITALVGAGLSRETIAAARGTSVQTVISQLRTIFFKCDVRREAELVALARSIMALG